MSTVHTNGGTDGPMPAPYRHYSVWGRIPAALRNILSATRQAHDASDLAQRAALAANSEAHDARIAYEADEIRLDPHAQRRGAFDVAVAGAVVLALVDTLPAWWAAEALGGGFWATAGVTLVFVAGLAGLGALMSYLRHKEA